MRQLLISAHAGRLPEITGETSQGNRKKFPPCLGKLPKVTGKTSFPAWEVYKLKLGFYKPNLGFYKPNLGFYKPNLGLQFTQAGREVFPVISGSFPRRAGKFSQADRKACPGRWENLPRQTGKPAQADGKIFPVIYGDSSGYLRKSSCLSVQSSPAGGEGAPRVGGRTGGGRPALNDEQIINP